MCVLLQTAGSVRLSVESLEATFLLFSLLSESCHLLVALHTWPSVLWKSVRPSLYVGFFFLSCLSCVKHHVWTSMFRSPTHSLSHAESKHSYTNTYTLRSWVFEWENPQAGRHPVFLCPFELSCLVLVCLWSGFRQLDVGGAARSFGWGESSEKHQWAEAWHGHASIRTYCKCKLAELQGWWRTRKKNLPTEENRPKTQSVNKNHTSQRYWPLEVSTISVEGSPKVLEKRWIPLGPDRWSSVEVAS